MSAMPPLKIFYSWQSDTAKDICRVFIREAIDEAVAGLEVNEADRPVVDQDTQGVLGSPVIADVIFDKIKTADVVVADVTLVGKTPGGKRQINSNVAIELGYALSARGDQVLLKIMNEHFGSPSHLPFDLKHRRWPVRYDLAPDVRDAKRGEVRARLVAELRQILTLYVSAPRPLNATYERIHSTFSLAAYWRRPEGVVTIQGSRPGQRSEGLDFTDGGALTYLRIWPTVPVQPLSTDLLHYQLNVTAIEPLCGTLTGWSNERNRFGRVAYE